ncbi:hypothetical protein FACS1894130_10220 [Spirochaetia bacterium]|nr:hypothetical protein FACS1894130_10220 [Spirochaetia bacterium]
MAFGSDLLKGLGGKLAEGLSNLGKTNGGDSQKTAISVTLTPDQLDNILAMGLNALEAGNGEEASNLFTQALTLSPQSTLALVGKGGAAVIEVTSYNKFKTGNGESAEQQAFSYWNKALANVDFGDEHRKVIVSSSASFVKWAKKESTERYEYYLNNGLNKNDPEAEQAKDHVAEKNFLDQFMGKVFDLDGMDSYFPFLEAADEALGGITGSNHKRIQTALAIQKFIINHPYRDLFSSALTIIKSRDDWHKKYRFEKTKNKYACFGTITVSDDSGKLKLKKIYIGFSTKGKKSFYFEVKKQQSITVGTANASLIAEQLKDIKAWNISANKKKLVIACSHLIKDDDLVKQIAGLSDLINSVVSEGKQICETITRNGGKLGFFAALTAK